MDKFQDQEVARQRAKQHAHRVVIAISGSIMLWYAATALLSASTVELVALALAGCAVTSALYLARDHEELLSGDAMMVLTFVCIAPHIAPLLALAVMVVKADTWWRRVLFSANEINILQGAAIPVLLLGRPDSFAEALVVVSTAAMALVTARIAFSLPIRRRSGVDIKTFARDCVSEQAIEAAIAAPFVVLVAFTDPSLTPWAIALAIGPMLVIHHVYSQYHLVRSSRDDIAGKATLLARTNLQFAAAMVRALDHRDAYTAGHSAAVAVYTRDIARDMGFDEETVRVAHLAGLVHDIGKIGVPGRVLNKTSPLDDDEYEIMKAHAAMGAQILGEVDLYGDIAMYVRYHHERIDGRGYPDGIGGETIPAISRMISVADTYSAMTTDRPYRRGMPTDQAMLILAKIAGTQLDTDFTESFLRILARSDEAYQRGKQTDFEVEVAKHQAVSGVEAEAIRVTAPLVAPEVIHVDVERETA